LERRKKLIEVSMPIDAINAACVREKSIRHGHPSTLHIYWARRPLAAARAVLFGQLIDDPSSRPDLFPTIEEQDEERRRLHRLIERAVRWEATTDQNLLDELKAELHKQFPDGLPTVLDPFAGGGAIPIESARLGLPTEASDLNPLAVLLNKAMIEIPQQFIDRPSLNNSEEFGTPSGMGHLALANDVRYYARELLSRVKARIGQHYPTVKLNGEDRTVIAWIWARTVQSPNPALPIQVPLTKSWVLSKKSGNEHHVVPIFDGKELRYQVKKGLPEDPSLAEGTFDRKGAVSITDGSAIPLAQIKKYASEHGFGNHLMAIVLDGPRGREYISPDLGQIAASQIPVDELREELPDQKMSANKNNCWTTSYGLTNLRQLFTTRQLLFFETLHNEMRLLRINLDEITLSSPGSDQAAIRDKISDLFAYLTLAFSRTMDYSNNLCSWNASGEKMRNLFARQVISMSWDFAESNPFSSSSGNYIAQAEWVARAIEKAPISQPATVVQASAATRLYSNLAVSTDPPYYDNVGYADLSDFFYPWLRKNLADDFPDIFRTISTPKDEELVADKTRSGSKEAAKKFFVEGFNSVFQRMTESRDDLPITIYYAYKQSDSSSEGTASTGWETVLDGLIGSGFEVTGTWPVRTEMPNRSIGIGANALASSIVIVARQRSDESAAVSRRTFVASLRAELPGALRSLIEADIAPVDFAQSAIGPGMAVFSRYKFVQEPDGSHMRVRDALLLINEILGELLNDQDVEMDPDSRFAMEWYKEYGWNEGSSGIAETLATAKDTSLNNLIRSGVFEAKAGKARLLRPSELTGNWDPATDDRVSIWECVVRLSGILEKDGLERVGSLLSKVEARVGLDKVKSMAYFAFYTAEKLGNAKDAGLFNALVSTWGELASSSSSNSSEHYESASLFEESSDENEVDDVDQL
jgi:putative DNA methylase